MRFATKRSSSGWTVWSLLATMYQLGLDFHAVPGALRLNRSGAGVTWVAQTSFCSCSGRSPAKYAVPDGSSQMRPSATSMWEKTSVTGNLFLLALRRLGLVRGERGDVDEPGDAVVGSRGGDDASAVGVADEDGGAADPPEGAQ